MISILIPAYNEENAIAQTVRNAKSTLEEAGLTPYEIVVIDDASTDKTAEIAEAEGAIVERRLQNMGYGSAIKAGIKRASYDMLAITDADGTYPLERIPDLVKEYQKGFHMVVGKREGLHYWQDRIKAPLRIFLKLLVEFAAGRSIPDINSGLRVFGKTDIQPYLSHLCNTFSFTTSLTLAYMMTGRYVKYIPIAYHARVGKTKVKLIVDSLRTLQYIVQAIIYYNPIKMFLFLSLVTLVFSGLSFTMTLIFGLTSTFYMSIGGVLTSIIIFSLGLLADLLRQIMNK